MATEVELHFLLMGITGSGKSATGNTLLNKQIFNAASNTSSETKKTSLSFAQFENKVLLVVDGPGLADTEMTVVQDREAAAKNLSQALAMCYGGVDAFVFVTKFGNRFTPQDTAALEDLKKIFGDKFMEHMIVVVTCGDIFQSTMEYEERPISFDDWCREQKGIFQKLYKDCGGRVVLFNNLERDEKRILEQRRKVVAIAEELKTRLKLYTSRCFQEAEFEREKIILQHKAPHLNKQFQEKICLLTADIENLSRKPSENAKMSIRARIKMVKWEIQQHDRGYGVLGALLNMVEKVESDLNDTEALLQMAKEIDKIRLDQKSWGVLRKVSTVAGLALALVAPPVGLAVGGACAVATGFQEFLLHTDASQRERHKKDSEILLDQNRFCLDCYKSPLSCKSHVNKMHQLLSISRP